MIYIAFFGKNPSVTFEDYAISGQILNLFCILTHYYVFFNKSLNRFESKR